MKHLLVVGDGMADKPLEELGGKTPLQYAQTPNLDRLARQGCCGRLLTIPAGFPAGSEVAHLSMLGYDVPAVFEGRGALEATGMGLDLEAEDLVLRCNLISVDQGNIRSHTAGDLSTEEATVLIDELNRCLATERYRFFLGDAYRHLLVIKGGNKAVKCCPPHEYLSFPYRELLPEAESEEAEETAALLRSLTSCSYAVLSAHPLNQRRKSEGKEEANLIWLWSPGFPPKMNSLQEMYGILSGSVITAVDLIRGVAHYAGLKQIHVTGATGSWNTDYEEKAAAALTALLHDDLVFLHIEAPDEAGHAGDAFLKVRTIEDFDRRLLAPLLEGISQMPETVSLAVLPDHYTLCSTRKHTSDPVPFLISSPTMEADSVYCFDEYAVEKGRFSVLEGNEFIRLFLGQ